MCVVHAHVWPNTHTHMHSTWMKYKLRQHPFMLTKNCQIFWPHPLAYGQQNDGLVLSVSMTCLPNSAWAYELLLLVPLQMQQATITQGTVACYVCISVQCLRSYIDAVLTDMHKNSHATKNRIVISHNTYIQHTYHHKPLIHTRRIHRL